MKMMNERIEIKGFVDETQHAFDKLVAYFAMYKTRMNPKSLRYVTKLNQFQLKFMEYLDKAANAQDQKKIKAFVTEIQKLVQNADASKTAEKSVDGAAQYANPNNGGEYWDGDVHIYEAQQTKTIDFQVDEET